MKRLFYLFNYDPLSHHGAPLREALVPHSYVTKDKKGHLFYNGVRCRQSEGLSESFDAENRGIHPTYVSTGWERIVSDVTGLFVREITQDHGEQSPDDSGWEALMRYDSFSTRRYMANVYRPSKQLEVPSGSLPMEVVNWCETMDTSTGSYDRAFSETVLEAVAFGVDPDFQGRWSGS